jgi:hypothetical protein
MDMDILELARQAVARAADDPPPRVLFKFGVPFSLACAMCDAGMDVETIFEALSTGWQGIEYTPDLPHANYLGLCPTCAVEEDAEIRSALRDADG